MRGDGSEDQFGFLNFTDFPVMIPDCAVLSPLFIKALSLFYLIELNIQKTARLYSGGYAALHVGRVG